VEKVKNNCTQACADVSDCVKCPESDLYWEKLKGYSAIVKKVVESVEYQRDV